MSDFNWYVYQSGQQMGPFSDAQVRQLLTIKMIAQDAFIFKDGWEDWRGISEIFTNGSKAASPPAGPPVTADDKHEAAANIDAQPVPIAEQPKQAKARGARVGIRGRVIAHNDGRVVISGGINISTSGIFVETEIENTTPGFQVGEQIKLTIKADNLSYPFNIIAEMMRFNSDSSNHPTGYGMKFIDLPAEIKADIEKLAAAAGERKAV